VTIEEQAMQLPPERREILGLRLLASVDAEPAEYTEAELKAELDRRSAAMKSGEDPGIPAEEVLAELKREIQERRL
jgi:putative addiction module component (TIGR02574 family)